MNFYRDSKIVKGKVKSNNLVFLVQQQLRFKEKGGIRTCLNSGLEEGRFKMIPLRQLKIDTEWIR